MQTSWNPWHGCKKFSEGCLNCYVHRTDQAHGKDGSLLSINKDFSLPVKQKRDGSYKIESGSLVYTCFTSDFLFEEADEYRAKAWDFIKERPDLTFIFFTKRICRLNQCLPQDWGDGYDNVVIGCTCENQIRADERLPIFLNIPIKHRLIIAAPLLTDIKLEKYLADGKIDVVSVGGESGNNARICDYNHVLSIREQCINANVTFTFHQTGARLKKDGRVYFIPRKFQHSQAHKANIDFKISRMNDYK